MYAAALIPISANCASLNRMRVASQTVFFTRPAPSRNTLLPMDTTETTIPAIWGVLLNPMSHLLQSTTVVTSSA